MDISHQEVLQDKVAESGKVMFKVKEVNLENQ